MSRLQPRHRAALCILLSAMLAGPAAAQAPAPSPNTDMTAADRAKRDAEKVFQWIRIHSDKPRKSAQASPAAAGDKAQAAGAPRATPRPTRAPEAVADTARDLPAAARSAPPAPEPPLAAAPAVPAHTPIAADASAPLVSAPPVEEEVALRPLVKSEPEFPPNLMRQLRKGLVQVGFTVKPDGSVTQVHAVSSSHPRLVASAVATVAQWRFQPVRSSQQAVVDLGFNLD